MGKDIAIRDNPSVGGRREVIIKTTSQAKCLFFLRAETPNKPSLISPVKISGNWNNSPNSAEVIKI